MNDQERDERRRVRADDATCDDVLRVLQVLKAHVRGESPLWPRDAS